MTNKKINKKRDESKNPSISYRVAVHTEGWNRTGSGAHGKSKKALRNNNKRSLQKEVAGY